MRVPAPKREPLPSEPAVSEPEATEPDVSEPAVSEASFAKTAPPARPRRVASEQPLVPASRRVEYEDLVDMTAMVDIVFFLLIFFLVTSMQALDASIPMPVPQEETAAPSPQPPDADNVITVNIDEMDRIWIDGEEVANEYELVARLYGLRDGPGNPDELLIIGSGEATHGTAVMVHDSGNEVGMSNVRLAIQVAAE